MMSGNEWAIVILVALVIFGGSQLPKIARNLGSAQKEFKKALAESKDDEDEDEDAKESSKSKGDS